MQRQLIKSTYLSSCNHLLSLTKRNSEDFNNFQGNIVLDVDLCMEQGYSWHPGYFICHGGSGGSTGSFFVEIYLDTNTHLDPASYIIRVFPFSITDQDETFLCSDVDELPFHMPSNTYKVIFESRSIERDELKNFPRFEEMMEETERELGQSIVTNSSNDEYYDYCPVLCRFTFIPTTESIEPHSLKDWLSDSGQLQLYQDVAPKI